MQMIGAIYSPRPEQLNIHVDHGCAWTRIEDCDAWVRWAAMFLKLMADRKALDKGPFASTAAEKFELRRATRSRQDGSERAATDKEVDYEYTARGTLLLFMCQHDRGGAAVFHASVSRLHQQSGNCSGRAVGRPLKMP